MTALALTEALPGGQGRGTRIPIAAITADPDCQLRAA